MSLVTLAKSKTRLGFAAGIVLGAALATLFWKFGPPAISAQAGAEGASPAPPTLESLQAQIDELKGKMPEQSAAMISVAQNFDNLWHAAHAGNWPLAAFCLEETEEGIEWATKLERYHKTKNGETVDLKGIFDGLKESIIEPMEKHIEAKSMPKFEASYRRMMEGCYACHKSVEKPYLRPQIPAKPSLSILNFSPHARWPQ